MQESDYTFEQAFEKLDELVAELEGQDLGLDESLVKYEQAVKMLKLCHQILERAEKKVELLTLAENGALRTTPFESDEPDDIASPEPDDDE